MHEFSVARLNGTSLSPDGRNTILKFEGTDGEDVWIKISAFDLQAATQEIGYLLTKSRQLSDISKQNILSFFRPEKYRANLVDSTVVISFHLDTGLESHFGLEPTGAEDLARQMLSAAERGKTAKSEARH